MRRRLYFLVPDREVGKKVVDALLLAHVEWKHIHVIAKRGPLLDALAASGFAVGLAPRRPAIGGMDELTSVLVRAFGSDFESGVDIAGAGHPADRRPDRRGL